MRRGTPVSRGRDLSPPPQTAARSVSRPGEAARTPRLRSAGARHGGAAPRGLAYGRRPPTPVSRPTTWTPRSDRSQPDTEPPCQSEARAPGLPAWRWMRCVTRRSERADLVSEVAPGEGPDPSYPRCHVVPQAGSSGSMGSKATTVPEPTRPRLDAPPTVCGSSAVEPRGPTEPIIRFAGPDPFPETIADFDLIIRK
jgi:hypothetical protein